MTEYADMGAFVRITGDGESFNVLVDTQGTSEDAAKRMASLVLEWLAAGKEAFIRVEPKAKTDTVHVPGSQFDGSRVHKGHARFHFIDRSGTWKKRAETDDVVLHYIGTPPK